MVERNAPGRGRETPAGGALGVGSELTGYRIEGLLGRGAMSTVYLAEEIALERKVALKLLAPELERREAFRAALPPRVEARRVARSRERHPGLRHG